MFVVGMQREGHLSDTRCMSTCVTTREGDDVRVRASGQLLSYSQMYELIDAVDEALGDPTVHTIAVDVSGVDEAGPGLSGILSVLQHLADGTQVTLTVHAGLVGQRWLQQTG